MLEDHRGVVGTPGPFADRQQSLSELLDREILPCLERPGRLLGPFDLPSATVTGKAKVALVWPSVAEGAHAPAALRPPLAGLPTPRPFSLALGSVPSPNLAAALRQRGLPVFGRPDWSPLNEADLWFVWLDHPLQITGVLTLLADTGIPLRAAGRDRAPHVVAAGPGAQRIAGLVRHYADWLLELETPPTPDQWLALGEVAEGGDLAAVLGSIARALPALEGPDPETPRGPDVAEAGERTPPRWRPDLVVAREFLDREPWREAGRAGAWTDHVVVGAGSRELRRRAGLPDTGTILDAIRASLEEPTASLALHFVSGIEGETAADRRAIADFVNRVVAEAPRGPRQVTVSLHDLQVDGRATLDAGGAREAGLEELVGAFRGRHLGLRLAAPGLAAIEALLAETSIGTRLLERVWSRGARHALSAGALTLASWREALREVDPARLVDLDQVDPGGAAPTGIEGSLGIRAPQEVSPKPAKKRGIRLRPDRWTRWRALVPRRFDYRIEFAKEGRMRFLGPAELSELLLGACENASVPVCTSGIVQPRPRIGYGPSLPAGIAADREAIDISLERKVDDLESRLASQLPEGIRLHAVEFMPRCSPSMQLSRIRFADYTAELDAGVHELDAAREADASRVRRWSRRIEEGLPPEGFEADDPLNQVCAIRWEPVPPAGARLEFRLDLGEEGPRCKPRDVVARALTGASVDPRLIPLRRRNLFVVDDSAGRGRLRTPLEQVLLAKRRQRALERVWAD